MITADELLAARAAGDYCPPGLNGSIDLHQALELQLAVLEAELASGRRLGGWKVGLTSEAARSRLGADERPFGFVLADRVFTTGAAIPSSEISGLTVETEMCFTIGRDITDPDITPDRILDHVSVAAAGFELNEQRPGSERADFYSMITDCLTNWGIVTGIGVAPTTAEALSSARIDLWHHQAGTSAATQVFSGASFDFVDDHTVSLCRLVDNLAAHGQHLRAGQRVITGAFARVDVSPGDRVVAEYRNLAGQNRTDRVEITIT